MKKRSCNQCHKQLGQFIQPLSTEPTDVQFWVCEQPECPNYGLLQIPAEMMKPDAN